MRLLQTTLLLAASLAIAASQAMAEPADCRVQLKAQDQRCQALAEKLAAACPTGTNIKETVRCRDISAQIADSCTRKPCAPQRKAKRAKAKADKPAKKSKQ